MERLGPADLTLLASDHGSVPTAMGALLVLAGGLRPDRTRALLEERLPRVPRLRQRLVHPPPGLGRPFWSDDPGFRLHHHLSVRRAGPGDVVPAGLDVATRLVCERLDPDRPLWRVVVLAGPDGRAAALVWVMHHVLADGLGGLAALAALCDDGRDPVADRFPRPAPSVRDLLRDNATRHTRALHDAPGSLRRATGGARELELTRRPALAQATSLTRPTSDLRRAAWTAAPLADVLAAAHARGVTLNDLVVTAASGAVLQVLAERGEHPDRLVVSVPVSGRREGTDARRLGNDTGVWPVAVPGRATDEQRLAAVAEQTARARAGVRGSSAAPLGLVFRALAGVGLLQPFISRQRLVHTFATNMRGPASPLVLGGVEATAVVPLVATPGNTGVTFTTLSYAGTLGVTVMADPTQLADPWPLAAQVRGRLNGLLGPRVPPKPVEGSARDRYT